MIKLRATGIQEQFWVLNQIEPENSAYNIASMFKVKGDIDILLLRKAINRIISRHDALRTLFFSEEGNLYQLIYEPESFINPFEIKEVSLNLPFSSMHIPESVSDEIHKPFNLTQGPLFRVSIFRESEDECILCIVFHHIITDLRSKEIFAKELENYYNSDRETFENKESVNYSFSEYSLETEHWKVSSEHNEMLAKWNEHLLPLEEMSLFPVSSDDRQNSNGNRLEFTLGKCLSDDIRNYSALHSITPFVTLLGGYVIWLSKLCRQNQITVGVPFTNRRNEKWKNTMGCFVNILPIQIELKENQNIADYLKSIRQTMLRVHRIQELPYLEVHSLYQQKVHTSLFRAGMTFENPMELNLKGLSIENISFNRKGSQLDCFIFFWEQDGEFRFYFEYSDKFFDKELVFEYSEILKTILVSMVQFHRENLSLLNLLSESQRLLIQKLNNTACEYDYEIPIHSRLEHFARHTPNAIAITDGNTNLNYNTFNRKVNRLAYLLIYKGIEPEQRVGICMSRSNDMMVAIFGILKAGGVYLPLNPDYPSERILELIRDATPSLVIMDADGEKCLPPEIAGIRIDNLQKELDEQKDENPNVNISPNNLAYIIYTSGSTGMPKGVMIEHHSVMNRLNWMQKAYPLNANDKLVQKTPLSFDVSIWELFWWSFAGASLFVPPTGAEKDPDELIQLINDENITVIHFVPTMFAYFSAALQNEENYKKISILKYIFFSGEALSPAMIDAFRGKAGKTIMTELVNLYGPTEATVDVSYYNIPEKTGGQMYIGRPIDNTALYIVNEFNNLLPSGMIGELLITGVNLSRGYLNRQDLTREKYIEIRLSEDKLTRAYKTGDLARLCPNGEIEYLGRIDNQVKIRGMRIELGEIEAKILSFGRINACVAIVKGENEQRRIIVYLVSEIEIHDIERDLKPFLRARLPDYMVPSSFIKIESIPFNASGKLDRKALPEPTKAAEITDKRNLNETERIVYQAMEDSLKSKDFGPNDNFFEIGGNSLIAISLIHKLNELFGTEIKTIAIFEYPTLRELSKYIECLIIPELEGKEIVTTDQGNKQREKFKQMRINRK